MSFYRNQYVPATHPLANGCAGSAGVHRVVLFDEIGPGTHACEWCGCEIAWFPAPGQRKLEVDHIDHDPSNNDPANLAPSCTTCNGHRGRSYWACQRLGIEWTGSAEQTHFAAELSWAEYEAEFGAFPEQVEAVLSGRAS